MVALTSASIEPAMRSRDPNDAVADLRRRTQTLALANPRLPLWPEQTRGIPNSALRSALFAAVRRGKRESMDRVLIRSQGGITIRYTGARLDQSDLDVLAGVLHLARSEELGSRVTFKEASFLRLIGRGGAFGSSLGSSDRLWLRKVLVRLKATALEVEQGPYTFMGSLIDEGFRDGTTGRWIVAMHPNVKAIFTGESWTQIDWNVRKALIGHPLAQWLHGFYSTHAKPYPIKTETLHLLCGSDAGRNAENEGERRKAHSRWVNNSLKPALTRVEASSQECQQAFSWSIDASELVHVVRDPSPSQRRHLARATAKQVQSYKR